MKVGEEEEKIKHVLDRKLRPKGNKITQDK